MRISVTSVEGLPPVKIQAYAGSSAHDGDSVTIEINEESEGEYRVTVRRVPIIGSWSSEHQMTSFVIRKKE
jgi:hypothetical protein